jgi:hypothetical protein
MGNAVLRRLEILVVAAIAAIWLPGTLLTDIRNVGDVDLVPHPPTVLGSAARVGTNMRLVEGAAIRIPRQEDFAIVFAGRWKPRHLQGGLQLAREAGASWTQYALAPRFAVEPGTARWLLLRDASPGAIGLHAAQSWRFGPDWLVRLP